MSVSNYEYPKLPRSEITTVLTTCQIANVTEQDLINPNHDFIFDLYTRILVHLDFLEEDNDQLDFDALEQLENPDFHVESVRVFRLFNKIKEVLTTLECPKNFTFSDLLTPDPKRTECFLSALLNFCLDRDARMNSVSEAVDEVSALEEQRRELEENKISELRAEISECNEAREREIPLVQEVEVKVKELKQTIAALNNNQMSLRTSLKKLKEVIGKMDEKISDAEFTLVQHSQENENLKSKIAQSPDKVQRALEEKKLAREEARNAERLAMQTFHEKTTLVEVYSKMHKKMSKYYKLMQDIQEQVNSAKSIEKELKTMKAKLSEEEILEKSLDAKLVGSQSKVEQMEELRKQLEKECKIRCEEATKHLNSTKSEVESKSSATETRQRNVEAVLSEVDVINSKITSVKESGAVRVERLVGKCEEVVKEYHRYTNSIDHVIESWPMSQG